MHWFPSPSAFDPSLLFAGLKMYAGMGFLVGQALNDCIHDLPPFLRLESSLTFDAHILLSLGCSQHRYCLGEVNLRQEKRRRAQVATDIYSQAAPCPGRQSFTRTARSRRSSGILRKKQSGSSWTLGIVLCDVRCFRPCCGTDRTFVCAGTTASGAIRISSIECGPSRCE